jgi:Zn-dependent protease with chaperone function
MTRSWLKYCLVGTFLGLTGCQTYDAVVHDKRVTDHVYQQAEGLKVIDDVKPFLVEPLEPSFMSDLMDKMQDKNNPDSPLNVTVRGQLERKQAMKAELARGLSKPLEVHERAKGVIPEKMQGPGTDVLVAYVESIVQKLLAAWPYEKPPTPFQVVILAGTDYWAGVEEEGVIKVNAGLLAAVKSEDELASVIAHEMSHILLNHFDTETRQQYDSKKMVIGSTLLSSVLKQKNNEGGAAAVNAIGIASYKGQTTYGVKQWQRDQEIHCDLLAVDLLDKAGYMQDQVFTMLQKLPVQEEGANEDGEATRGLQGATDPTKVNVGAEMANGLSAAAFDIDRTFSKLISGGSLEKEGERFDYTKTSGLVTHPSVREREYNYNEYDALHYATQINDRELQTGNIQKFIKSGSGHVAITRYLALYKARNYYVDEEYGRAIKVLSKLLKSSRDPDPIVRLEMFRNRSALGQRTLAIKNLEIAIRGSNVPANIYMALLEEYRSGEEWDKVIGLWDSSWKKMPQFSEHQYLTQRARYQLEAGRHADAQQTVAVCKRRYPKFPYSCDEPFHKNMKSKELEKPSPDKA